MSKKYLDGTKMEDIRGMKFGKLTVIDFDWDRFEKDKIRKLNCEIAGSIKRYWMCMCECGKIKSIEVNHIKRGKIVSCGLCYTFEDWCLDNNHQDYLDLWDYELNDCKPSEIGSCSNKKYWFKCKRGIHESETRLISGITRVCENNKLNTYVSCSTCSSIGQHMLDTYGNIDHWDISNHENPFKVQFGVCGKKYLFKCIECNQSKFTTCYSFYKYGIACNRCSDGFSYPNRFMANVLSQICIGFESEYSPEWIKPKRYDFYIPSKKTIIEMDGGFHYRDNSKTGQTVEESNAIDTWKDDQAALHGIDIIRINCNYASKNITRFEYIRENILKSKIAAVLNLNNVDFEKCDELSNTSLVKLACKKWKNEDFETTLMLSKNMGIDKSTIIEYLKIGTSHGWCNYDPIEEKRKTAAKNGKLGTKRVEVFKDGVSLGVFNSATELSRISSDLFGIKLSNEKISRVCRGDRKLHKGFSFIYLTN